MAMTKKDLAQKLRITDTQLQSLFDIWIELSVVRKLSSEIKQTLRKAGVIYYMRYVSDVFNDRNFNDELLLKFMREVKNIKVKGSHAVKWKRSRTTAVKTGQF